jgi:putative transposase
LAGRPEAYPWSSATAHISGRDDVLVRVSPLLEIVGDWDGFLSPEEGKEGEEIRRHERTGRPLGNEDFIIEIENLLARILRKQKPEPKAQVAKSPGKQR